jgi:hypothetical protein
MQIDRRTSPLLLAITALLASTLASAQSPRTGLEYVVAFQGTAADATAAIADAGGSVVELNPALGVALVSAADEGFLALVRAHGLVTGAGRNVSIGTVRPDMPRRYAEERP